MTKETTWIDKAVFVIFAVVLVAAYSFWMRMESKWDRYTCDTASVIIGEGQTLYQIVHANCTGNLSNAVDQIVMDYGTTQIYPGQEIWLPVQG
jgi:hypothetical protein